MSLGLLLSKYSKYWWPASLTMLVIVSVFSLIPLPELPDVPGSDKTHHLIAYALIMLPISLRKPKYWYLLAFAIAAWSGVIELVQPFVNRYGEWLDFMANVFGLFLGMVVAFFVNKLLL